MYGTLQKYLISTALEESANASEGKTNPITKESSFNADVSSYFMILFCLNTLIGSAIAPSQPDQAIAQPNLKGD